MRGPEGRIIKGVNSKIQNWDKSSKLMMPDNLENFNNLNDDQKQVIIDLCNAYNTGIFEEYQETIDGIRYINLEVMRIEDLQKLADLLEQKRKERTADQNKISSRLSNLIRSKKKPNK